MIHHVVSSREETKKKKTKKNRLTNDRALAWLRFFIWFYVDFVFKIADDKDTIRPPGMGRITGSASIETLVRVGIEKENGLSPDSKMIVLHDFTPCVDDELEVKQGNVSYPLKKNSLCLSRGYWTALLLHSSSFDLCRLGCERSLPRKRLGLRHRWRSAGGFHSSLVLCAVYTASRRNDPDRQEETASWFGHTECWHKQ